MFCKSKIITNQGKEPISVLYQKYINNQPLPKIKTFNTKLQQFELKDILNITKSQLPTIELKCSSRVLQCTPDQKLLTLDGWIEAGNLVPGQLLKASEPDTLKILHSLNPDQEQIVLGSFLGDGCLPNHGPRRYRLKIIHGMEQKEYCQWKALMFDSKLDYIEKNGYSQKPAVSFCSKMFGLENDFTIPKNSVPQWILDKLDLRGLAIWIMDDGSKSTTFDAITISTCSFDHDSQLRMIKKLNDFGIVAKLHFHKYYYLKLNKQACLKLYDLISPYVHDNLAYKIKTNNAAKYDWDNKFNPYGLVVVDSIKESNNIKNVYHIKTENNNYILSNETKHLSGIISSSFPGI